MSAWESPPRSRFSRWPLRPATPAPLSDGLEAFVRLGEGPARGFEIERPLAQRLGIPLAAAGLEEVSAVDVDGARQATDRVGHGVDGLLAEAEHFFLRDRRGAPCRDLA